MVWEIVGFWRLFVGKTCSYSVTPHMVSQKTSSKEFYQPLMQVKTFENVLFVVQTTDQRNWLSLDYTIWIPPMVFRLCNPNLFDIGEYVKECAHLMWGEGHFRLYNLKHDFFSCGPHCTDSFCGPGRPKTSINRCPCFHN